MFYTIILCRISDIYMSFLEAWGPSPSTALRNQIVSYKLYSFYSGLVFSTLFRFYLHAQHVVMHFVKEYKLILVSLPVKLATAASLGAGAIL